MTIRQFLKSRRIFLTLLIIGTIILGPFSSVLAQDNKRAKAVPLTTKNPSIAIEELDFRLKPLTKDDLLVEANGWLEVLKDHVGKVSEVQIWALRATDDKKTKLLESVTKLKEQQTALSDRFRVVVEALKSKGGKVEDYESYLKAISGVEVDVSDASATWTMVTGWLTSSEGGIRWAKRFSLFLFIVLVSWALATLLGKAAQKAVVKIHSASELLKDFIVNVTRKIVFVIGFVVALSMLGINIGPLLAAIGAAGFIVGFALQGTLSNFAAGIMILVYRPYDVGDLVDIGGTLGKVEAMTIVSTTLRKVDNQKVIVPNNMIWGDIITNATGTSKRRVDMVFGIGYSDDIAKAQKILEEILENHQAVLKDPPPVVKVHELGDSSVNFVVRPWVETENYWDVYWDVTRTVKERFDAEGVSIPFPQRDVHIHNVATT
ncbi:MAG: mechanosensitive ion channel family protein [Deltaproteobacteria bacterium]|nr:MAG: mechanosensitive ion channel family protein [Deltaproteobacteria bacterium]